MQHDGLLRRHFDLKVNVGWVSLLEPGRRRLLGYRTARVAKVQGGGFFFTIGGTAKGRRCGLNRRFRAIIKGEGLTMVEVGASHGLKKRFVGFYLAPVSESALNRILANARTAIGGCEG